MRRAVLNTEQRRIECSELGPGGPRPGGAPFEIVRRFAQQLIRVCGDTRRDRGDWRLLALKDPETCGQIRQSNRTLHRHFPYAAMAAPVRRGSAHALASPSAAI